MTHFTDAELIRWSDAGPGSDRDRVVTHLAECGACAARYAAALRTRPLEAAAAAEPAREAREFADAAARLGPPAARVIPLRRRIVRIGAPLAAAAAIVLAIAIARRGGDQGADIPPLVLRGGTLSTIAPDGETTIDARFEWASGVAATRYKITVGGPSGAIYTFIVRNSPAPFPDGLRSLLVPGTPYWWTVTALDAEGRLFLVAERRPFRIRAR
jgi:hypothetical protein